MYAIVLKMNKELEKAQTLLSESGRIRRLGCEKRDLKNWIYWNENNLYIKDNLS